MPGMTPEQIIEAKGLITKAHEEVERLATGESRWRMSIPANPNRDSDLVISAGLGIGTSLLAEVDRLKIELEPLQTLTHQACPKKEHADWFIDSEHNHLCPWCRIAELEATPADWDAQRRRADELEAEVEQLAEAARNALASLDMFIQDHPDPGTQALGDRHLLAQALRKLPAEDGGARC